MRTFLLLGMLINLGLVGGLIYQGAVPVKVVDASGTTTTNAVPAGTSNEAVVPRLVFVPSETNVQSFSWSEIESDDYLELIENLRSIGCPNATVRDIVLGRAADDYDDELWQTQKPSQSVIWDFVAKGVEFREWPFDESMRLQLQELGKQRDEVLRTLRAELGKRPELQEVPEAERWTFLTREEQSFVREIYEKHKKIRDELLRRLNEKGIEKEEMEQIKQRIKGLSGEKEAELIALVGEDGYAEYQARGSVNARRLRAMPGLVATEEEMREIVRRQDEIDRQRKAVPRSDPGSNRKWNDFKAAHGAVYSEVLGTNRWARTNQKRTRDYRLFRKIARRHGLPADVADRVDELRRIAERNARELTLADVPDPELRAQAVQAIELNVVSAVMGAVGEEAWPTMEKYGMDWYGRLFGGSSEE